jgi:hypothetical protein
MVAMAVQAWRRDRGGELVDQLSAGAHRTSLLATNETVLSKFDCAAGRRCRLEDICGVTSTSGAYDLPVLASRIDGVGR